MSEFHYSSTQYCRKISMADYSWAPSPILAFWSAWKTRNSAVKQEGDKISNVYSDVLSRSGNGMQKEKVCLSLSFYIPKPTVQAAWW